jgi:6-pyruvoyltetrahydropterin/6-carboxytetrahydropterin synthase
MYTIRVSRSFSGAHQIHGSRGRCENVHGHNYRVEVELSARHLNRPGMVADFARVGAKIEDILPDHRMLNEVYDFNPTAENLARRFFELLSASLPVTLVRVWETDCCCAEYRPD